VTDSHESHWFEPLAEHMGSAYLRYSFTKGTEQEVAFLIDAMELHPGMRVLDVGCGPGRHAHALARGGFDVVGIDISERFIEIAGRTAAPTGRSALFLHLDVRDLHHHAGLRGSFDAVISLCQGGFGLLVDDGDDLSVLAAMAATLRPGGVLALSAFSAYHQVRYLGESDFDAATGINHEHTVIKSESGDDAAVELWTSCWTPKELRLACANVGLAVEALWSVEPGAYARRLPDLEHPEFLLIARPGAI
jgi:SAM-dependent methyltransferase